MLEPFFRRLEIPAYAVPFVIRQAVVPHGDHVPESELGTSGLAVCSCHRIMRQERKPMQNNEEKLKQLREILGARK